MQVLSHQLTTVGLSITAVVLSSMTALLMAGRAGSAVGKSRLVWAIASATALGIGVWSMHFIGVLALRHPLDISFDGPLTLLSILPTMLASLGMVALALRPTCHVWQSVLAAALAAAGIVLMHYVGMEAMRDIPPPIYTNESVAYASLIAFVASLLGFQALRSTVLKGATDRSTKAVIFSGLMFGLAASGMHYMAMSGTILDGQSVCISSMVNVPDASILGITGQHGWLAVVIFLMLAIVNVSGLLVSIYDSRLEDENRRRAIELEAMNAQLDRRAAELARELAKEKSVFEAAAEATRDCIFSWNPATGRLFLSGYSRALFGLQPESQIQSVEDLARLLRQEDRERFLVALARAADDPQSPLALDARVPQAVGEDRWVLFRGRRVGTDGGGEAGPVMLVGAVSDISSQKQAEQEAHALADRQKEVATLRSQIIRILSHELRTPLAILSTGADLLRAMSRPVERVSQDKLDGYFDNMDKAVEKVKDILKEALQYNRLESGEFEARLEPVNLRAAVAEVARSACQASGLPNDRIRLIGPTDWGVLQLDRALLEQVLRNLFGNALKYSDGKVVEIRYTLDQIRGQWMACIDVVDQGIGIPADMVPNLFTPFSRGANVGTRPGTGLGLSIAHRAADALSGLVRLISTGPEGTTFRLKLPAAAPDASAQAPRQTRSADSSEASLT